MQMKKKLELEEENRKIRVQNMTSLPERAESPKFPWGVDQRKFSNPRLRSSPSPEPHYESIVQQKKMTKHERKEMLVPMNKLCATVSSPIAKSKFQFNSMHLMTMLAMLERNKTLKHVNVGEQREEKQTSVSKRVVSEEDREKIKEFMNQKNKKIKEEQMIQQISKKIAEEKIKGNLERLSQGAKEKIEKEAKLQRKSHQSIATAHASKKSLNHNPQYKHSRTKSECMTIYNDAIGNNDPIFHIDAEEGNESLLYHEYKNIMKEKAHRVTANFQRSENDVEKPKAVVNHDTLLALVQNQKKSQKTESPKVSGEKQMWKDNVKKRFDVLVDRYEKNFPTSPAGKKIKLQEGFQNAQVPQFTKSKQTAVSIGEHMTEGVPHNHHIPYQFAMVENHHHQNGAFFEFSNNTEKIDHHRLGGFEENRTLNSREELVYVEDVDADQASNNGGEKSTLENYEIWESAATFIQKNFRGYLTRKALREYFQQLCENQVQEIYENEPSSKHEEVHPQEVSGRDSKSLTSSIASQMEFNQRALSAEEDQHKNRIVPMLNLRKAQNEFGNEGLEEINAGKPNDLQYTKENLIKIKEKEQKVESQTKQQQKREKYAHQNEKFQQYNSNVDPVIQYQTPGIDKQTRSKLTPESEKNEKSVSSTSSSQQLQQQPQERVQQKGLSIPLEKLTTTPISHSPVPHTLKDAQNQTSHEDLVIKHLEMKETASNEKSSQRENDSPWHNHLRFSTENKNPMAKSESDLLRDNIIAELRKIEAENQKENDAEGLEKELDRAHKQPKTTNPAADDSLMKFEESAVGPASWSGRDSQVKEIESPGTDKKMKNEAVQTSQDSLPAQSPMLTRKDKTFSSKRKSEQITPIKEV